MEGKRIRVRHKILPVITEAQVAAEALTEYPAIPTPIPAASEPRAKGIMAVQVGMDHPTQAVEAAVRAKSGAMSVKVAMGVTDSRLIMTATIIIGPAAEAAVITMGGQPR